MPGGTFCLHSNALGPAPLSAFVRCHRARQMKTLAFSFCVILIAAALFVSGWQLGHRRRAIDESQTMPVIDKRIEEAGIAAKLLHDLDNGNTNEIRWLFQGQMLMALTHVDSLSDMSDARSRELARGVAAQIAKYRAEGSPSFTGKLGSWSDDSIARFEAILRRASQE